MQVWVFFFNEHFKHVKITWYIRTFTSILSRYNRIHVSLRGEKMTFSPEPRSGEGENKGAWLAQR